MHKGKQKHSFMYIPLLAFIFSFMIGISIPLNYTPHYGNYMSRIWSWTEILIALTALFYITQSKTFHLKQAIISLLLGTVCLIALFRDPRHVDIIITSICVAITFYGGCRIFEKINRENSTIRLGISGGIKYFLLGAVVSIPLALINVLFFALQGQVQMENLLYSAVMALKPAISEEVIFHYFLMACSLQWLQGKGTKRFSSTYMYILMVLPHTLLHYPDMILSSPMNAILMIILNSVVFGFPMAYLMKRKNLQMAVGMHWFIDFVRFAAGF